MAKNKKNDKNYLDFVPIKSTKINWSVNDHDFVVLEVKRTSFFDKFAQKLFKVPHKSDIKLDKHGSFVWKCIDDNKSIYEISKEVKNHFGKDCEPLLERLISFFNILNDNKFITFNHREK